MAVFNVVDLLNGILDIKVMNLLNNATVIMITMQACEIVMHYELNLYFRQIFATLIDFVVNSQLMRYGFFAHLCYYSMT